LERYVACLLSEYLLQRAFGGGVKVRPSTFVPCSPQKLLHRQYCRPSSPTRFEFQKHKSTPADRASNSCRQRVFFVVIMIFSDMMVFVVLLLALKFQPDAFPSILVDYGWMVLLTEIELFIFS
jgi:hypothetical protein